jgi:hypothetical protein
MPAVFAEMDRDPVSPRQFRLGGRPDWVGLAPASGLSKGGDMVDIHSQTRHTKILVPPDQSKRSAS